MNFLCTEARAQALHGPPQQLAYARGRDAQRVGDLLIGQVFDVVEAEDRDVASFERRERGLHARERDAVGGLTEFADGNKATISRAAEGGKSYSVRLQDLVKRGDISANVDMRPGDIVVIPQSWF